PVDPAGAAAAVDDWEDPVHQGKLAEQAERYHKMAESMKKAAGMDVELTAEERNLLSVAYKNKKKGRRQTKMMGEYWQMVETELKLICCDILDILDKRTTAGIWLNFRKEAAENSLVAYKAASDIAMAELPTHPIHLGLALNFSVFYYEILNSPDHTCRLAKAAFDDATAELDTLIEESYKDSTRIMESLCDNLTLWTSDTKGDGEDQDKEVLQDVEDEKSLPSGRCFHKGHQLWAPLTLADFEAINRCERSLPKNFNFAGDVLDQWSQKEKGRTLLLNYAQSPSFHSPQSTQGPPSFPGLVFVPGTTQLTAKDILHWLQASKVKCTVASEEVIPAVESIVSECPGLKTKFLLSPHSQNRWLSFQELFQTASAEHSCVETGRQEPMAIYFTSGTTGSPKMAQHFQSSLGIGYTLCGRYKFKKLRYCLMGGEPLNPEGIICANQKGQEIKPGSVGKGVLPYDVQVVKAFVVLSAPFKSSNPEKLTLELQDHVKKSTAPYKYPRKASIVHKS
ncbi:hypothetical protein E2I00_000600, partial [Balaenoptera physalus]